MEYGDLFNINMTIAKDLFIAHDYIWNILPKIHDYILELGKNLDKQKFNQISENVWIAKSAKIATTATIIGPAIIDENSEIRHSAFIRGNVIVGKNAVVGNSTELKNCILFDEVEAPHFNYIGDSILGYKAHLGAGCIVSNLRLDKKEIIINKINTKLKKIGAFIGDGVQVGCNCVVNPGTIIGKNAIILPLSCVNGVVKENTIIKK